VVQIAIPQGHEIGNVTFDEVFAGTDDLPEKPTWHDIRRSGAIAVSAHLANLNRALDDGA
jgi:hypothetical protein